MFVARLHRPKTMRSSWGGWELSNGWHNTCYDSCGERKFVSSLGRCSTLKTQTDHYMNECYKPVRKSIGTHRRREGGNGVGKVGDTVIVKDSKGGGVQRRNMFEKDKNIKYQQLTSWSAFLLPENTPTRLLVGLAAHLLLFPPASSSVSLPPPLTPPFLAPSFPLPTPSHPPVGGQLNTLLLRIFAKRRANFDSSATSASFSRRRRYSADDFSLADASAAVDLGVNNKAPRGRRLREGGSGGGG